MQDDLKLAQKLDAD
jgi:16S rRNA U1498 N3-methylase RsmE